MKRYVIAAILASCLTITLFLAIPTRSIPTVGEYDPWADINDDGKINMYDIGYTARLFGTSGEAINKTDLLLQLLDRLDQLNTTVVEQQNIINNLNNTVMELQDTTNYLNTTIDYLNQTLIVLNNTKGLGTPDYNSGWVAINQGQTLQLQHNLHTKDVLVYVIGNDGYLYFIHQISYGGDVQPGDTQEGLYWHSLTEDSIKLYRYPTDSRYYVVRVMIWKFQK